MGDARKRREATVEAVKGNAARNPASNDRIGRGEARRKTREVMSSRVKLIESSGGTADPARQENKHEKKLKVDFSMCCSQNEDARWQKDSK